MKERWPFLRPPLAWGSVRAVRRGRRPAGLARRGRGEDRGGDHEGEADGPDPHRRVDADEHETEAGDDPDGPDEPPSALERRERAALHLRGELRVLGSERLLHLFEHLLLVV